MNPRQDSSDSESNSAEEYKFSGQSDSSGSENNAGPEEDRRCRSVKKGQYKSRGKCLNKNAVMARQNRLRKKLYLENLEEEVESLREENRRLKSHSKKDKKSIKKLTDEVKYLRSLVSNRTDIWKILNSLNSTLKAKEPSVTVERLPTVEDPLLTQGLPSESGDPLLNFMPDDSERQKNPRDEVYPTLAGAPLKLRDASGGMIVAYKQKIGLQILKAPMCGCFSGEDECDKMLTNNLLQTPKYLYKLIV
ncbi:uncharacterized protein LOC106667689 isoform X1 [Cimex lectularius]|uniref:BZIP domain-containing protein n=1 Tax=Cimex lectularius TaxID=79782 RepID=A0A8I6SVI9_CIMLE|nr:uncharacterized protein LOC106667689 isoform X1 [Cimex lectularius]